jgi:death-on-curing protein
MTEPSWLEYDAIIALQAATIMEFGGAPGLRDDGLLRSALARPQNLYAYEGVEDILRLAACYAYGIAKNHSFVDGDKRAAFLAAVVFIETNGFAFSATEVEAAEVFLALAAGDISEAALADWLRANSAAR